MYWRGALSWSSRISLAHEGFSGFFADLSTASNRKLLRVLKNLQAPVTLGNPGELAPTLVWAWGAGAEPWAGPSLGGQGDSVPWREGRSLRCGVTSPCTCFWWAPRPCSALHGFFLKVESVRNKASTTLSLLNISLGTLLTCCGSYQNTQEVGKVKGGSASAVCLLSCA